MRTRFNFGSDSDCALELGLILVLTFASFSAFRAEFLSPPEDRSQRERCIEEFLYLVVKD